MRHARCKIVCEPVSIEVAEIWIKFRVWECGGIPEYTRDVDVPGELIDRAARDAMRRVAVEGAKASVAHRIERINRGVAGRAMGIALKIRSGEPELICTGENVSFSLRPSVKALHLEATAHAG